MLTFSSFSTLEEHMRTDKEKPSLNPVRIINVETMEMWVLLKKFLFSMSKNHIHMSDFCEGEDTTPNLRRLNQELKLSTETICVIPVSEHLRINPGKAESFILELLAKEYQEASKNSLFRVYIPLYRMRSVINSLSVKDPRKEASLISLVSEEETDYSLTIIQSDLDVELSGNEIHGYKEYLRYWEQNPDKPLILHTSNAVYFEDKTFFDDVKVIVTPFDLIQHHYSLPSLFQDTDGKESFWNQLAQSVSQEKSFEAACCAELSINRFNVKLFEKWKDNTEFQRWLLWMWTRAQDKKSYLVECALSAKSKEQFIENVFCNITNYLESPTFDYIYEQRKQLLHMLKVPLPSCFWTRVESMSIIDVVRILTDLTEHEKEAIFKLIQGYDYAEKNKLINVLRKSYKDLSNYLRFEDGSSVGDFEYLHESYFEQYRWCKATNNISEEFLEIVKDLASKRGEPAYLLKARNHVVSEEYDDKTVIAFVDGMGAEYIDYLAYVLSGLDKNKYYVNYRCGFCNLPSTTDQNKDFLHNRNVIFELLELDELKHGSNQYPDNIIKEMAFLDKLREKIEIALEGDITKVILTSDHGTSRLAVLIRKTEFDNKLPPKDLLIYKYGRYCEGTINAEGYPTAIESDGKLIFADYTRFEQKGAPIDEIHGGASLEEWLVPIITIEKIGNQLVRSIIKNNVILLTEEAKIDSFTKMVTIKFKLEKPDDNVISVNVKAKRIICEKDDDRYIFKYRPVDSETEVTANVLSDVTKVGQITFKIRRPLSSNENFDI